MSHNSILFLDFDGCICDSYVECYAMAWYAYHKHYLKNKADRMELGQKAAFRKLRPMVRNSEDNVVIQHIIQKDIEIAEQKDFDNLCDDLGTEKLEEFRGYFYKTREYFLAEYRDFWLGLNVIFPPLLQPMRNAGSSPVVYILSTKKPSFIAEILKYNNIDWPFERILEARGRSKESIMLDIMAKDGKEKGVFVDDQISHLRSDGGGKLDNYLAEWGYVSEDAKTDFSVPHMSLQECAARIKQFILAK